MMAGDSRKLRAWDEFHGGIRRSGKTFDVLLSVEECTLSNRNEREQRSWGTTTTEQAQDNGEASLEALTPREEKVLRMLHGMSEDDSRKLQFALGADEETRMKLAMIEDQLLGFMDSTAEEGEDRFSPAEFLSSWLDNR